MASTSARTLQLLSLLQARRWWPGPELAGRLEVSERTLRRDVDRLRELGYPVHAQRGLAGGYRWGTQGAGAALPPLLVDDEEAVALAVAAWSTLAERGGTVASAGVGQAGEQDAALRALTKLVQLMPPRLRRRLEAVGAVTTPSVWSPAGAATVDHEVLTSLALACRDTERVRFGYTRPEAEATGRHVEPYRLVALAGQWYLVGYDLDRRDWRTFRLDRIERVQPTRVPFAPRRLPFTDAGRYVTDRIRTLQGGVRRVEVLVRADEATTRRRLAGWGAVTATGPGCCRVVMEVTSLDWPLFALGSLGADFEVVTPPELAEQARAWARRFERAAGTEAGEGTAGTSTG